MSLFPASFATQPPASGAPRLEVVRQENIGAPRGVPGRAGDIVLVTEGTYPHAHGGVSVWCDQLVRGLDDRDFRIVALTAFSYQRPVWDLPDHVRQLVTVGLWDHRRHRSGCGPGRGRRPDSWRGKGRGRRGVAPLAAGLAALLSNPREEVDWFVAFLDTLAGLDPDDVAEQLGFAELVRALDAEVGPHASGCWEAVRPARASDLVRVADMLDHLLRPVTVDPGPASVYHASSNGLAALVCLLAQRRHGAAFVLTEHGIYLRERYLELRRLPLARPARALLLRFHRLVSGAAYARASLVTPGSRWNLRWETRHGARKELVRTIYNGIEPDEFPERTQEPPEPVVAWLGRIDPIKDLETLITAFAVVRAACPEATLRLYGRTPPGGEEYRAKLDQLVADLDLAGAVVFAGGVAESADAYVDAQIGVLSSISEGFPYALIEAMVCGLPAVATGVGGVDEAVADTGLVVPPRAPELLGQAIAELLADGPRRRRLGQAARQRVLDQFTLAHCLDGYRQAYAEVCRTFRVPHLRVIQGGHADLDTEASSAVSTDDPAARLDTPAGSTDEDGGGGGADGPQITDLGAVTVGRPTLGEAQRAELVAALGGAESLAQTVDADEVAATLESVGVTDQIAETRFGTAGVFELAEGVWRVGGGASDPPRPVVPPTPQPDGAWLRGLAYVLPAAVVAAAVRSGAHQGTLVAASVVGWGLGQAGGVLAYTALHRAPRAAGLAPLARGLGWAVVLAALIGVALAVIGGTGPSGALSGALPLLHLVGATGLIVAGRTRRLLAALVPVSLVSVAVLVAPGTPARALVAPFGIGTVAVILACVARLACPEGRPRLAFRSAASAARTAGTARAAGVARAWGIARLARRGGRSGLELRSAAGVARLAWRSGRPRLTFRSAAGVARLAWRSGRPRLAFRSAAGAAVVTRVARAAGWRLQVAGSWRRWSKTAIADRLAWAEAAVVGLVGAIWFAWQHAQTRGAVVTVVVAAGAGLAVRCRAGRRVTHSKTAGLARPAGGRARLLERADWVGAVPLAVCGWCTAGFALLSVSAASHLPGLGSVDSRQWLVLGLPLWLMVAGSEWFFLATRRTLRGHLEASGGLRAFRRAAVRTVLGSTLAGAVALGLAVALATAAAAALSGLTPGAGLTAAAIFGVVALALYGITVLTAAAHPWSVLLVTSAAVLALAWVAATGANPLGLTDPYAALVVGAGAALALCGGAGRALTNPASHR